MLGIWGYGDMVVLGCVWEMGIWGYVDMVYGEKGYMWICCMFGIWGCDERGICGEGIWGMWRGVYVDM